MTNAWISRNITIQAQFLKGKMVVMIINIQLAESIFNFSPEIKPRLSKQTFFPGSKQPA